MSEHTFLTATSPFDERLARLKEIISESKKITFFGGAGVSTGSGIPDFRSENGLYNNMPEEVKQFKPEYLLSRNILFQHPEIFYKFYREHLDLRNYEPNTVHKYFAHLEELGKMEAIVTQNVDLLHEKAGTKKLFKIHGTVSTCRCEKCGAKFDMNYIFDNTDPVPRHDCKGNGLIRPDVVFYGEQLPTKEWDGAVNALHYSDCLIVCGTSLAVQPAASLVSEFEGKYLVIVNMSATDYDNYADLVFHEDMNAIFSQLLEDS